MQILIHQLHFQISISIIQISTPISSSNLDQSNVNHFFSSKVLTLEIITARRN